MISHTHIGIVGAGIAGLDTALQLVKKGVDPQKITLFDMRAGSYTRPGYINTSNFQRLKKNYPDILTGMNDGPEKNKYTKILEGSINGHIKDYERMLYQYAKTKKINIENKSFESLDEKRLSVKDSKGVITTVTADYLFDASGTKRVVLRQVKDEKGKEYFTSTAYLDNPIKKHGIAFIKIPERSRINPINDEDELKSVDSSSLTSIKALGWNRHDLPHIKIYSFGKDKYCLYFEAPENLNRSDQNTWIKNILKLHSIDNRDIPFEELPPSSKGMKKPRILFFDVDLQVIKLFYKIKEGSPTIIALGDAVMNPFYRIQHGINTAHEITIFYQIMSLLLMEISLTLIRVIMNMKCKKHYKDTKRIYRAILIRGIDKDY